MDLEKVKARFKVRPIEVEGERMEVREAVSEIRRAESVISDVAKQSLAAIREAANAPREVVRDSSGKVTGVRTNGRVQNVVRADSGQITGVE